MGESEFLSTISGRPCANCEARLAKPNSLFCDDACKAEYEGVSEDEL